MRRGFTLLEMLVATAIMGIAVVGLLANINTSIHHAGRLADYERAALLARTKMDELLLDRRLPLNAPAEGRFDAAALGGVEAGWRAQWTTFETPPDAGPGSPVLERLQLDIWWMSGGKRRTLAMEGYRRGVIPMQGTGQ
jgi:general secretion pathway protein I